MKNEAEDNLSNQVHCLLFAPKLCDYVDGRLPANLTWMVKDHLAVCSRCADKVKKLASVSKLLGSATKQQLSQSFDTAIEARIAALPLAARRPSFLKRLANISELTPPLMRGVPNQLTASMAAVAVCFVFASVLVKHDTNSVVVTPNTSRIIGPQQTAMPDSTTIETCMSQHRSVAADDPLSDTSAQLLNTSVDNLPVDSSKTQELSDDDAAELLD